MYHFNYNQYIMLNFNLKDLNLKLLKIHLQQDGQVFTLHKSKLYQEYFYKVLL